MLSFNYKFLRGLINFNLNQKKIEANITQFHYSRDLKLYLTFNLDLLYQFVFLSLYLCYLHYFDHYLNVHIKVENLNEINEYFF